MRQKEHAVIEGLGRGQPPRAVAAAPVAGAERAVQVGTPRAGVPDLSGIARDLAASPPVDSAKVDRLRAAIAGGSYRADPEAIAAAMIAQAPVSPKG